MCTSEPQEPHANAHRELEWRVRQRRLGPRPPVSVVVPYAGSAANLSAVLWSLAGQSYPRHLLQVVVVECPSAEPAERLLTEMSHRLELVRVGHERTGFAPAHARNRGLAASDGSIVVALDDDVVAPSALVDEHLQWHRAGGSVATFGLRRFIAPDGRPVQDLRVYERLAVCRRVARSASNRAGSAQDWRLFEARRMHDHPAPFNCFHGCNLSYSRSEALAVGGWNEAFDGHYGYEDIEFGARLHAAGAKIAWARTATVLHIEDRAPEHRAKEARLRNFELACRLIPSFRSARRVLADAAPVGVAR